MSARPSQFPRPAEEPGTGAVRRLRAVPAGAAADPPTNDNAEPRSDAPGRAERASGPAPARARREVPTASPPAPLPLPVAWRLTYLPGDGQPAIELSFAPRAAVVTATAFVLASFVASVAVGWLLRAGPASAMSSNLGVPTASLTSAMRPRHATSPSDSALPARRTQPTEGAPRAPRRRRLDARGRAEAQARAERLGIGTVPAAQRLLMGLPEPEWVEASGPASEAPSTLLWPVLGGGFVRGYGSGEEGYHLAVDVSGDTGWDVRASAGGIVGYAGNGIRGYGNIVMLIHPGGWITMYAHNDENVVVSGQRVEAGETIAHLGNTGISRGPHVHYEFMHHGKNCDPVPIFRPGVMHRSGAVGVRDGEWDFPYQDRDVVQCGRRRRHPHSRYVHHADPDLVEEAPSPAEPSRRGLGAVGQAAALAGAATFAQANRGEHEGAGHGAGPSETSGDDED